MNDSCDTPQSLALSLPGYVTAMRSQAPRDWNNPANWPEGETGGHKHPVVYTLWTHAPDSVPLYVGETVDLGKRLSAHFNASWRTSPPRFVRYIELPEFECTQVRLLAERFLIVSMKPTDNSPNK